MSIATAPTTAAIPSDWTARRGAGKGLKGVAGHIRLKVGEEDLGVLNVADGAADITPNGAAETTLYADTLPTLVGLLGGEVQPIVARLQNRVRVEGDVGLVLRTFFGLRAGSPWTGLLPRS